MRSSIIVPSLLMTGVLILALAACGDSTPESSTPPSSGSPSAPSEATAQTAAPASEPVSAPYTGPSGDFATIPVTQLEQAARDSTDCVVDLIDGKPLGGEIMQLSDSAVFVGWVADATGSSVPADVRLVLSGAQNYSVGASTGLERPDVATALSNPAFSTAGYGIKANLAQVAAGDYAVMLMYSASGEAVKCDTQARVVVK